MKELTSRISLNVTPTLSRRLKLLAQKLQTTEQKLIRGVLNKVTEDAGQGSASVDSCIPGGNANVKS